MGKGYREFEYAEHTADLKVIGYGNTIKKAIESVILGMANAMYDIQTVESKIEKEIELTSDEDIYSLIFDLLTYILDLFYLEKFLISDVKIKNLRRMKKDKKKFWYIRLKLIGEILDKDKHKLKKEVKAVTYHEMKLRRVKRGLWKLQVVFDV